MNPPSTHNGSHRRFPLGLYFAGALGVLSGHWLSLHLIKLLMGPGGWEEHAGQLTLLAGALTFLLGWLLWRHHHHYPHRRTWGVSASFYAGAFCLVAAAGWFAYASEHWLLHGPPHLARHPAGFAFLAAGLLGVAWFVHSRLRDRIGEIGDVHPRTISGQTQAPSSAATESLGLSLGADLGEQCRALVLMISTPNLVPAVRATVAPADPGSPAAAVSAPATPLTESSDQLVRVSDGAKEARLTGGAENLEADIEALDRAKVFWNWQQILRALRGMSRLETVILLGSPDSADFRPESTEAMGRPPELEAGFRQRPGSGKGSFDYLDSCARMIAGYLPVRADGSRPTIEKGPHPVDFEDFNALTEALREVIAPLRSRLAPQEILVDVTGGQKVTSIAGAVLTVNNELRFQYVQTNRPYATMAYDLVGHSPPSIEPHA